MEESDAQLISDYQAGSQEALEILVSRYLKTVYFFIARMVGQGSEADDITQDTFVKVWKNLDKYDPKQNFKTWVLSIAKNTTYDWFRKKKALNFSDLSGEGEENIFEDNLSDLELLPDEIFAQKELASILSGALDKIPLNQRTILVLHLEDELTFEEIAKIVDKPMNTVKSQYRRALLVLRQFLVKNAPN
jgi:RNA polymerase sigma-70 factor (ECF subfamily)